MQGLHAEAGLHRGGQAPGQNPPRIPIDDRHQEEEASRHRDVGYIGGPDLIDLANLQIPQQIRVDRVFRGGLARVRLRRGALEPHQPHQSLYTLAVDDSPFRFERLRHHPAAEKRVLQMKLVHPAHQLELLGVGFNGFVVKTRPIHAQQLALPAHRQPSVGFHQRTPRLHRNRPSPRDKKSFSTVSSPIF